MLFYIVCKFVNNQPVCLYSFANADLYIPHNSKQQNWGINRKSEDRHKILENVTIVHIFRLTVFVLQVFLTQFGNLLDVILHSR